MKPMRNEVTMQSWFDGDPTVIVDREEITVIGRLPKPTGQPESEARASGRVSRFREDTRSERMRISDEAQEKYGRKVSRSNIDLITALQLVRR